MSEEERSDCFMEDVEPLAGGTFDYEHEPGKLVETTARLVSAKLLRQLQRGDFALGVLPGAYRIADVGLFFGYQEAVLAEERSDLDLGEAPVFYRLRRESDGEEVWTFQSLLEGALAGITPEAVADKLRRVES